MQRVLLIDDSPLMQRLVEGWLKGDQIEVIPANTGLTGFSLAVTEQPDIILLDVDMPDINGFELCKKLRSDNRTSGIPIVFLTGAASPEDRVEGLNLGAVDYIIKPFHPAEFQARVRAALRTKYLLDLLKERAQIDGLTALRNRAYLDQRLEGEIALLKRRPGAMSVIMLDVDNFKLVNDNYGHLMGDDVLRWIGDILQNSVRTEDVVARFGGEEFVIITPGIGREGAHILAERLRQRIASTPVRRLGSPLNITCSFGIAEYQSETAEKILENADAALYAAKRQGKNCVVIYDQSLAQQAA